MAEVTLSATPKGNGFQATVTFLGGVSINSAESYPTIAETIIKLLDMPDRLTAFDRSVLPSESLSRSSARSK